MATMLIIVEDNTIQTCQVIFLLWWPTFEHTSTGIKLGFCFRREILFLFSTIIYYEHPSPPFSSFVVLAFYFHWFCTLFTLSKPIPI